MVHSSGAAAGQNLWVPLISTARAAAGTPASRRVTLKVRPPSSLSVGGSQAHLRMGATVMRDEHSGPRVVAKIVKTEDRDMSLLPLVPTANEVETNSGNRRARQTSEDDRKSVVWEIETVLRSKTT
jgi:hypothetical protein